jgi:glycosyltransferase involved in cell wall biosynthesis
MKLLFVLADFSGSSWYRIIQPAGLCTEIYEESKWAFPTKLPIGYLQSSDILIIQRQFDPIAVNTVKGLTELSKIIISEIDDNLWSIPTNTPIISKFWTKENIRGFEKILGMSKAVTVSTPRLAKLVKEFNDRVYVIPNLVVMEPNYIKKDYGKIRIGWAGSDSHLMDFTEDIQQALLDIKDKYKEKVDIFMFGASPEKLFTHVSFYPFTDPHIYMTKLQELGIDIGLVPNRPNLFNECRSNIKFLEYSSVKAVTVADNIESYRTSINNGENGILIKKSNRNGWFKAIQDLIENEQDRRRMADNAFKYCYENYSVQKKQSQYQIYGQIYNELQGG